MLIVQDRGLVALVLQQRRERMRHTVLQQRRERGLLVLQQRRVLQHGFPSGGDIPERGRVTDTVYGSRSGRHDVDVLDHIRATGRQMAVQHVKLLTRGPAVVDHGRVVDGRDILVHGNC